MKKRYKPCRHSGPRLPGAMCTDCRRTCQKGHGVVSLTEECQTCPDYEVKVKAQHMLRPLPVVQTDNFPDLERRVVGDDHNLEVQLGGQGEQQVADPLPVALPETGELERLVQNQ